MKILKLNLKSYLKNEKLLVDIFIFGSVLKGKEHPNDIDIIGLFKDKKYELIEGIIYDIKQIGDKLSLRLHIEPLFIEDIHSKKIYSSLLYEGFSILHNESLTHLIGFKSALIFTYSLIGKTASEKVMFSYALYGRIKEKGLLGSLNGKELGKGAFFVPFDKEEEIKLFFKQWGVKYTTQRTLLFEK